MQYNSVFVKTLLVCLFQIPYIGAWLFWVYKINTVLQWQEYNNIFIFISAILFLSTINYNKKEEHIIDVLVNGSNIFVGTILYLYSTYLSFCLKNSILSLTCIISHLLLLHIFISHSKKYIEPYLNLSKYIEVDTVDIFDDDMLCDVDISDNIDETIKNINPDQPEDVLL